MSDNWVQDINEMHSKFGFHDRYSEIRQDRQLLGNLLKFRLQMCMEELNESIDAALVSFDDDKVVDGLIDLCVFALGTLDLFRVDPGKAWNRVYDANLKKLPGIKPGRPNPFGFPDLLKPDGWEEPSHKDNCGDITLAVEAIRSETDAGKCSVCKGPINLKYNRVGVCPDCYRPIDSETDA